MTKSRRGTTTKKDQGVIKDKKYNQGGKATFKNKKRQCQFRIKIYNGQNQRGLKCAHGPQTPEKVSEKWRQERNQGEPTTLRGGDTKRELKVLNGNAQSNREHREITPKQET